MTNIFDELYFKNYSLNGYDADFLKYSLITSCIKKLRMLNIPIKSVCILGTATGQISKYIHENLGVIPEGCELSKWAYSQTPIIYAKKTSNSDLREYVPLQLEKKKHFDLVFSNAFVYLSKKDLKVLFTQISQLGTYLHYDSSVSEEWVEDSHRNILESYKWWTKALSLCNLREISYGLYKSHCPPKFYKNEKGRTSSTLVRKGEIILNPDNYQIPKNAKKSNVIKLSGKAYKSRRLIYDGELTYS